MEANLKKNGLYNVWIAYSLANLAEISRKRGRGDDADRYFKRSLEVMAEAKLDNSSVPETMENYAKLLRQTGRARDGERMEIEAKARRTRLGKE